MHCLKSSEIKKWLTGQGMRYQPMDAGVPIAGEYQLPADAAARAGLADGLADILSKDGNQLIEVIPPDTLNSKDSAQLELFRSQIREERPVDVAPGHLFKSRDRDDFKRLLSLLLGFGPGWETYVYSAPSRTTLLVNGKLDIWAVKRGLRNELGRWLTA